MVGLNFPEKLVVIGETFYPTGNNEKTYWRSKLIISNLKGKSPISLVCTKIKYIPTTFCYYFREIYLINV